MINQKTILHENKKRFLAQTGRSKIKTLFTLMFIGGVIVSAIIGLNKAEESYRTDKLDNQISQIKYNLQKLQYKKNNLLKLNDTSDGIELGIFPKEMIKTVDGEKYVIHAGGDTVDLVNEDGKISIIFNGLSRETTIDLATKSKWEAESIMIGDRPKNEQQ